MQRNENGCSRAIEEWFGGEMPAVAVNQTSSSITVVEPRRVPHPSMRRMASESPKRMAQAIVLRGFLDDYESGAHHLGP